MTVARYPRLAQENSMPDNYWVRNFKTIYGGPSNSWQVVNKIKHECGHRYNYKQGPVCTWRPTFKAVS